MLLSEIQSDFTSQAYDWGKSNENTVVANTESLLLNTLECVALLLILNNQGLVAVLMDLPIM